MPVCFRYSSALRRDVARVAAVHLARDRVLHEAVAGSACVCCVNGSMYALSGSGTRSMSGLLDLLEPADRRAVEPEPVLEAPFGELVPWGRRSAASRPGRSAEAHVHDLGAGLPGEGQDLLRRRHPSRLPFAVERWTRLGALEGGVGPRSVNTSLRLDVVLTSGDTRTPGDHHSRGSHGCHVATGPRPVAYAARAVTRPLSPSLPPARGLQRSAATSLPAAGRLRASSDRHRPAAREPPVPARSTGPPASIVESRTVARGPSSTKAKAPFDDPKSQSGRRHGPVWVKQSSLLANAASVCRAQASRHA